MIKIEDIEDLKRQLDEGVVFTYLKENKKEGTFQKETIYKEMDMYRFENENNYLLSGDKYETNLMCDVNFDYFIIKLKNILKGIDEFEYLAGAFGVVFQHGDPQAPGAGSPCRHQPRGTAAKNQ